MHPFDPHDERGSEALEYVAVTVFAFVAIWVIYLFMKNGGYQSVVAVAESIVSLTSISFGW